MTSRRFLHNGATAAVLLALILSSSGCFAKKIMAEDNARAPSTKEITNRIFKSTIGQLLDQPVTADDVWLLPTPTPVSSDLFDRVFGKAREIVPTIVAVPSKRTELWGTVTVSALNVRSNPSTEAEIIDGLIKDQEVIVQAQDGEWLQIVLDDGRIGWVAVQFMDVEERAIATATPMPAASVTLKAKAIVLADSLNVRSQPSTGGSVVGSLVRNQCVDLVGEQIGWYLLGIPGGVTGWSAGDYLQPVDDCSQAVGYTSASNGGSGTDGVQPVSYQEPAPAAATGPPPMQANAMVVSETYMHECWGGGWDELRFVSSSTPVEVLGTGAWTPPADQLAEIGPGPYLKIRIWDGQYGWIADSAVNVNAAYVDEVAGECLENERIDWSTIVHPTPVPLPTQQPTLVPYYTSTPSPVYNTYQYGTPTPTPTPDAHEYRDE